MRAHLAAERREKGRKKAVAGSGSAARTRRKRKNQGVAPIRRASGTLARDEQRHQFRHSGTR